MPGLPPPAELRELALLNTAWWAVCLINPAFFPIWKVCYQGDALRSWSVMLGHQSALARSGQYVVRTMRHHAVDQPAETRRMRERVGRKTKHHT